MKRLISATLAAAVLCGPAAATPDDPDQLQAAYTRYLRAIETAQMTVDGSMGMRQGHEEEDRYEAGLFLNGIIDASVTMALIDTPDYPLMALVPVPADRLGLNNPDNLYYAARFSDGRDYKLTGLRGLARTFVVQVNNGLPGLTDTKGKTLSYMTDKQLSVGKDGSFSIALSREQPTKGDWLALQPGSDNLLVRFSYQDWAQEQTKPSTIAISTADGEPAGKLQITRRLAAEMLEDAATSIEEQADLYSRSFDAMVKRGTNKLYGPHAPTNQQATASHQWSFIGTFSIEPDEAMVITVKDASNAKYYNLEAANAWLNTFEFVHHQSSLNRSQLRVDPDGYIRFVVSPVDPGVPNWIDTTGATQGWIWSRWQDVDGQIGPEYTPKTKIVKRADLRSVLPEDTPVVTPEQRREALAEREALLRQRFSGADPSRPELLRRLRAVEELLGHPIAQQRLQDPIIR